MNKKLMKERMSEDQLARYEAIKVCTKLDPLSSFLFPFLKIE